MLYKQGQGTECVHRRVSEHLILVSTQHVNPRALLLWHGGMYLQWSQPGEDAGEAPGFRGAARKPCVPKENCPAIPLAALSSDV